MTVQVKTDKYIRVVGYFGKVNNMNEGKTSEYNARKCMRA